MYGVFEIFTASTSMHNFVFMLMGCPVRTTVTASHAHASMEAKLISRRPSVSVLASAQIKLACLVSFLEEGSKLTGNYACKPIADFEAKDLGSHSFSAWKFQHHRHASRMDAMCPVIRALGAC